MPTITFASPKGGVGKTTSATLLASELAQSGAAITVIDADPNHNIAEWASRPGCPDNLNVISNITEETIIDEIEHASTHTSFVIIDLEGTASLMVSYAISMSDLVVIPIQGSHLDARQAARAIRLIENQERATRRRIHHAVLFCRTSVAITPRTLRHVRAEIEAAGVPILRTQIVEREAFRALFSYGGTLESLAGRDVANVASAITNARAFTAEIVEQLRGIGRAEAAA